MTVTVRRLAVAPVKGTRLQAVERVELSRHGVPGDRRFYLVDDRGRMINGKQLGELHTVVARSDGESLELRFPDGRVVHDLAGDGETVETRFYSRPRQAHRVLGPFSEALSEYLDRPVTLVRGVTPTGAVDRGAQGAVSLISRGSLATLAQEAGVAGVDARRFRMTVEIDGVAAHAEDGWVGRRVRIGAAVVRVRGHVGRCLITSRDPESGVVDLPTLDVLGGYRSEIAATEPLPFGVYAEVVTPGPVRLADPVAPLDETAE